MAGATDLTLVLDEQLRITWQSPAASRLFGLTDDEVVGRAFADLIHPDDVETAREVIDAVLAGEDADGPPALVTARLRDGAGLWRDTESTISDQRGVPEVAALRRRPPLGLPTAGAGVLRNRHAAPLSCRRPAPARTAGCTAPAAPPPR